MTEKGCDNCYYSFFDERAYPCSLCIRGIERTDQWQPSKKTKADRKSEPSGYCNECKWYGDKQVCGRCRSRNLYAPKTEPTDCNLLPVDKDINVRSNSSEKPNKSEIPTGSTISKMEQVEMMSCAECIHKPIGAEICEEPCHYAPKDESQTEQWHYDEKDNTWYPYQHKSCATCKHALGNWDGESNNCGRCCGADRRFYEPIEDEPQTERSMP